MNEYNKGKEKTGGREKGTPNKISKDIKDIMMDFIQAVENAGGMELVVSRMMGKEEYKDILSNLVKIAPKDLNIMADIKPNALAEELKLKREAAQDKKDD